MDLNATQNLMDDFAMRLTDEVKKIPNFIDKGFSINLAGFGVGAVAVETDVAAVGHEVALAGEGEEKAVAVGHHGTHPEGGGEDADAGDGQEQIGRAHV